MRAPETEGEWYDRLKAMIRECDLLAERTDEETTRRLASAQSDLRGALANWLAQG